MSHIFISYARADRAYADRVKALLENAGYSVWLDTSNLDPNQDFTAEIEYAIKDASHFVVCLTKDVQRKDSFVRREIAFALNTNKKRGQETPVRKLPIIPMVFPEGELTVNISTLTGIIIRTDADIEDGCAELLVRLRRLPDEEFSQSVEVYPEEIAVAYLDSLQDFTSSKLHESVYNLLTLAATSASSISVTNPFSFTFSVSPAIDRGVSINKHETTFSSFHDAFQHQDGRVFMIGQPGAGKTTTLLAFARDSAVARLYNPKLRLPILKSIHTWRPGMEVSQWLFSDIAIYGKEFLEGEKFIFILDGLDELGKKVTAYTKRDSENVEFDISYLEEEQKDQYEEINIDPREFLLDKLSEFTTDHQLVISIRIEEYVELKQSTGLSIIRLQSLDNTQIKKYFSELNLLHIWQKATSDAHLLAMVRTPLLLSLFTYAFLPVPGESPPKLENLTEDKILDLFVHRRFVHESARQPRLPFDEPTTRQILSILSAHLIVHNEIRLVSFRLEDISNAIKDKNDASRFIAFCQTMHFFQRTRSTITQFTHLKLQDFFSFFGLEIIAKSGSLREREISVEVLALLSKDKSIPNLVKILKNDNYTYVKARVILALIFLKRIDGIKECFLLLEREKNPNNLKKYFEALDSYHNVKILPTLLKIAYTDNQYLFSWIGKTLTKYGDTALNRLISKMRAQTISDKRKTVRLIGMFQSEFAFKAIVSCLSLDETSIRVTAAETLAKFGRKSSSYLLKLLSVEQPTEVQLSAIKSLAMIREPKSVTRISRMLEANNNFVRQQALDALGLIPNSKSANILGKFLVRENTSDYEKHIALTAIRNIGDPSIFPYLLECFKKSNEEIRVDCAQTMIICQRAEDISQILEIYENEIQKEVIEVLAQAIGRRSNLAFLPRFHDALRSKNRAIRAKALLVVRQFGDPSSTIKLKFLYDNPPSPLSPEERSMIMQMLI